MKLARFMAGGAIHLGRVDDVYITSLSDRIAGIGNDMLSVIANWEHLNKSIVQLQSRADFALDSISLLAPIERPGKIFCIGLNYADHAAEAGGALPEHQVYFTKPGTAVNAPYGEILKPIVSAQLDYEAELVFVIGKRSKHATPEQARSAIFGYCVGNDVSVRDWQLRTGQFTLGKSFDTHAPYGPYIVTADEIDAGNLGIRSFVNGERRQNSNTRHLVFDPVAQVMHLSQAMTLEPGDLIFTGTPGGVGIAMKPPQFLKAGDCVRIEIDGVGHIENTVVDEMATQSP
jgi:ureidoglycolate lyase